jgi:flagellar hook-basal body complex protein FliE
MADLRITSAASGPAGLRPASFPQLESPPEAGFGASLGKALSDVHALQVQATDAASRLASGQTTDMVETLVTIEKANVAFQFAMQMRNKLLEAYQEIMRIQV